MAICGVGERVEGDWGGVRVRGGEKKQGESWGGGGGGEKPAWLPGEPPANRSVSKHTHEYYSTPNLLDAHHTSLNCAFAHAKCKWV